MISSILGDCGVIIFMIEIDLYTLSSKEWAHPELFGRGHAIMAEIYLTYLSLHQVKALPTNPFPIRGEHPS